MKSKLGQNFLKNKGSVFNFLNFCNISNSDSVLEIGVGQGALTYDILAKNPKNYTGIEIEKSFADTFEFEFLDKKNRQIINADILRVDLQKIIKKQKITKIIGAIPYYISSPIIHKIIYESCKPLSEVYLITQFEFAERVLGINRRSYFTNFIQNYCELNRGKKIKKECFYPKPKVDSMYFNLSFNNYPLSVKDAKKFSLFLHKGFKNPRKKITKAFKKEFLENLNINPNLRPENLSLLEWQSIHAKENSLN